MSFLDTYVKKYRLDKLDTKTKKNVHKLEKKLDDWQYFPLGKGLSFEDVIKDHANFIADLIERVSEQFGGWTRWKLSFKQIWSSFRFVISIATEVYQIVEKIKSSLVFDTVSEAEGNVLKRKFGQDLVWFIWTAVGPMNKTLTWLPFRKTIEKMIVRWIAGMGLDAAKDLFQANKEITSFAMNTDTPPILKAIE